VRSWLSLLALAVVVAALGAWVYQRPKAGESLTYALSTMKPGQVARARLERTGAPRLPGETPPVTAIVLERRNGEWRMSEPYAARADAFQVERLLSILEARSTARYEADDPARFGLKAPMAVLKTDDQTFAYGAINPTTREQYVMTGGKVYVVPLNYAATLPRNVEALLTKQLFGAEEVPVRFDLPGFTVAMQDGTWAVAPITNEAGPDERNAWVAAWREASALTVSRYPGPSPEQEISVVLKNGRTITLGIAQRSPDVVLVREDEGIAYQFFGEPGRKLLMPPGEKSR
jgi:hypothetical protein